MSDFLKTMAESSQARCPIDSTEIANLTKLAMQKLPPKLQLSHFDLIAEIKKTSPAEGELDSDVDIVGRADEYQSGGAACVSVLTEPGRFEGSLDDLARAAGSLNQIPSMRKDFLVEPVQIIEARAAGAGGVLLIAAMLDDAKLLAMCNKAIELDLFVLLEAFDAQELRRIRTMIDHSQFADAAQNQRLLVGVNTRDLRTLAVDSQRLQKLAGELPADIPCVAESGILNASDAAGAAQLGYQLVLVGSALMRARQPQSLLADMLAAGREVLR